MALRVSLLRTAVLRPRPSLEDRSDFEELYADFDSHDEFVEYLRRPAIAQLSREYLHPLRDVSMIVRDRFKYHDPAPRDGPWIREQTGYYVGFIVRLALPCLALPILTSAGAYFHLHGQERVAHSGFPPHSSNG